MPKVTITGPSVRDSTTRKDNRPWYVWAAEYQDGGDGGVVTPRRSRPIYPSQGVLAFEVEAGIAVYIQDPDGSKYLVTTPNANSQLWDVIAAGVAYPPDTRTEVLAQAVDQYVETARSQFRTRAVPVDPDNPTTWQWYDENGDAVGDPVDLSTVFNPAPYSHIFFDTDGVPFFESNTPGGATVLSDTDGTPYLPSIGA